MGKRYVYRIACIIIAVGMISISSFAIGNEVEEDDFSNLGYNPADNEQEYKEWCEETFDNGDYIYNAYKEIAFNIKYVPELSKVDFWQTPIETAYLKKGDCEDAVFLFFSQLHSNQKNAEIVWGWVINKQSAMGRAHVWYQLTDNRGQQYIVEGFSKDWNGIIPMEIVEETESRSPIFTMSHSAVSRLASSLSGANDQQIYQSLIDLLAVADSINGESHEYTTYRGYLSGHQKLPDANKEISNILKKLHELLNRYEGQKEQK